MLSSLLLISCSSSIVCSYYSLYIPGMYYCLFCCCFLFLFCRIPFDASCLLQVSRLRPLFVCLFAEYPSTPILLFSRFLCFAFCVFCFRCRMPCDAYVLLLLLRIVFFCVSVSCFAEYPTQPIIFIVLTIRQCAACVPILPKKDGEDIRTWWIVFGVFRVCVCFFFL